MALTSGLQIARDFHFLCYRFRNHLLQLWMDSVVAVVNWMYRNLGLHILLQTCTNVWALDCETCGMKTFHLRKYTEFRRLLAGHRHHKSFSHIKLALHFGKRPIRKNYFKLANKSAQRRFNLNLLVECSMWKVVDITVRRINCSNCMSWPTGATRGNIFFSVWLWLMNVPSWYDYSSYTTVAIPTLWGGARLEFAIPAASRHPPASAPSAIGSSFSGLGFAEGNNLPMCLALLRVSSAGGESGGLWSAPTFQRSSLLSTRAAKSFRPE